MNQKNSPISAISAAELGAKLESTGIPDQERNSPRFATEFENVKPEDFADSNGNVPILVTALEKPEVREALNRSDIILGVDCSTGKWSVFFGLDLTKQIISTGQSDIFAMTWVLYDGRTDRLEYLRSVVQELKGSCCFGQK